MKKTISICLAIVLLLLACSVVWFSSSAFLEAKKNNEQAEEEKPSSFDEGGAVVDKDQANATVSSGNVAYIGLTNPNTGEEIVYGEYATLQAAINALDGVYNEVETQNVSHEDLWNLAKRPIIYLCSNITITSTLSPSWLSKNVTDDSGTTTTISNYDPNRVRTVYIAGGKTDATNAKITSNVAGPAMRNNAYYNLTLEDIDLDCTKGYALAWYGYSLDYNSEKATTSMIGCTISATGTTKATTAEDGTQTVTGEGVVFKVTGNRNDTDNKTDEGVTQHNEDYTINIIDTDIVSKAGTNATFLMHHGAAGTLNIDGKSSIEHVNNIVTDGGDTMFMLGSQRSFEVNIASGAKLTSTVKTTQASSYQMFATQNSTITNQYMVSGTPKQTINIEDGAVLTINSDASYTKPVYFIYNSGAVSSSVINVGTGVTMNTNTAATTNGFGMVKGPDFVGGEKLLGVNLSADNVTDKLYGRTVGAGTVSGAVTMNPMYASSEDFRMVDGADLRYVNNSNGIRFTSYIADALRSYLDESANATYGTIISRGDKTPTLSSTDIVSVTRTTWANQYQTAYCAALINIPHTQKAVNVEMGGRAYMTLTYPDGQSATIYADFDSEKNVKSLWEIATELVEKDEANREDPAVAAILEIANIDPETIVKSLYSSAVAMKSNVSTNEYVLPNISLSAAVSAFEAKGYEQQTVTNVTGASFSTVVLKGFSNLITIYELSGEIRILTETDFHGTVSMLNPNTATNTGTLEVVQVGIQRATLADGTLQTGNPLNGMCYIVKLSDGSAIIIDGGYNTTECAQNIYRSLVKLDIATNEQGQRKIAAWIISHGHGDHAGAFTAFAKAYGGLTEVENFIYNIPAEESLVVDYSKSTSTVNAAYNAMSAYYPNAKHITPHANLNYHIGNATISMLYTPDLLYSTSTQMDYYNNTALIFKIGSGTNSAFFFTDSGEAAATTIKSLYSTSTFKSDILQITHHALYTEANNGHTWTNLKTIYDAIDATYAFLPLHSYGRDSEKEDNKNNGRWTVLHEWSDEGYQISYFTNKPTIDWSSGGKNETDGWTSWEESCVANGSTGTYYGYNGINQITNSSGLVTYLGSSIDDVMVTSIIIGGGAVTLNENKFLAEWFDEIELPEVPDEIAPLDDVLSAGNLGWWN